MPSCSCLATRGSSSPSAISRVRPSNSYASSVGRIRSTVTSVSLTVVRLSVSPGPAHEAGPQPVNLRRPEPVRPEDTVRRLVQARAGPGDVLLLERRIDPTGERQQRGDV